MAKKKARAKIAVPSKQSDQIFKLHVSLSETEPVVWRRIMVPATFSLEALHSVIQLTMGWQMSHLYDFQIGSIRYADPDDLDDIPVKSLGTSLTVALKGHKSFVYNYDFGDSWRHTVLVEDVLSRNEVFNYPICIGGENACPPEDCGGTPGFEELKEKVKDPENEEYFEIMRWLGGYYSPFSFDANRINRDLLWAVNWKDGPNDQGLFHPYPG
jgi:hypothetical protein